MSKGTVARLIRSICFVLILTVVLMASSYMLAPKDNTKSSGINNPNAKGFMSESKNSIDVAVIGNSDAYSGFSPMELWNNYGYTSYVSAEGRQVVSESYSILKRMLECQSPKVVILEVDGIFTDENITQSVVNIFNASMGSSFSVFQYHDRWKHVKPGEMLKRPKFTAHCSTKGQKLSNSVKGYYGKEYMIPTDKLQKMPISSKASLNSFVRLCKQNDVTLVFLSLPSESSWNYKKHNCVQKYADDNDIKFIDMNLNRDKFKFDWKTDTRDKGNHLNNRGARKATQFIGKYLKENVDLTDHRNDKKFNMWNNDYNDYIKSVKI